MRTHSPIVLFLLLFSTLGLAGQSTSGLRPDPPITCTSCAEWNTPREPFRIFGNTFYVGTGGLSSVLITSDAGHILLDGALPQSAALIDAGIRALGFRTEDVELILNSHAHYDHAGGIAALQRLSGAVVAASGPGARALAQGGPTPDDPQFAFGPEENAFPAVAQVKAVADGEELRIGSLTVRAHHTPGHTPGSTTWRWRSCEGTRCLDIVYADSLTAVSAPGFRFSGDADRPSLAASFRKSIATVAALPCDIVISVHPGFTDLDGKVARRAARPDGPDPMIDVDGCGAYAAQAARGLDTRLAEEAKSGR